MKIIKQTFTSEASAECYSFIFFLAQPKITLKHGITTHYQHFHQFIALSLETTK